MTQTFLKIFEFGLQNFSKANILLKLKNKQQL